MDERAPEGVALISSSKTSHFDKVGKNPTYVNVHFFFLLH